MDIQEQPSLSFGGVDIINVNFESNRPFDTQKEINIDIDAKLLRKDNKEIFKVFMFAKLESEDFFLLEVQALGNFKLNNVTGERQAANLINVNAPAIMFPYIRSFITSFTANCGDAISTVVLPPHFFGEKLESLDSE